MIAVVSVVFRLTVLQIGGEKRDAAISPKAVI